MSEHLSVLLNESIEALNITLDGVYVDGTFGRGGHSRAILSKLGDKGKLLVIDQDPSAISVANELAASDSRVIVCHSNFSNLEKLLLESHISHIDGILLDLGVSSPQLDQADRGFSFSYDGPLDMRMDNSRDSFCRFSAQDWINSADKQDIADVLWKYGEERYSRKIAAAIVASREQQAITTTLQLAEIIKLAHPNWPKNKHPATKSFMAIRLFINQELEVLESGLEQAVNVLKPEGRLVIISFHSLEDRIVKNFFKSNSSRYKSNYNNDVMSKLPIKEDELLNSHYSQKVRLKIVQKPQKAGIIELDSNLRARSATLRVAEKL